MKTLNRRSLLTLAPVMLTTIHSVACAGNGEAKQRTEGVMNLLLCNLAPGGNEAWDSKWKASESTAATNENGSLSITGTGALL
jgi:hypothetical protein